jgi:DNA invertase Pin-like site-specific DNA recombinase
LSLVGPKDGAGPPEATVQDSRTGQSSIEEKEEMSGEQRPTGGKGLASLRISGPDQDLNEQRKVIQKWLDDYGLSVVEWYSDIGSRLEAYKREGFKHLLKRVEKGDIRWVVVESLDRFGCRSPAELGKFLCHLQDHNVRLYCISEGIEATDDGAFTTLTTTISGLRSTDELRARSHRSLKGKVKLFRDGTHGGGVPPYGYALACYDRLGVEVWRLEYVGPDKRVQHFPDGRTVKFDGPRNTPARQKNQGETLRLVLSRHTERQEWVKKIFLWYTQEAISYVAISNRLNSLGVDALNGKGWSGTRVKLILRNPAYVLGRSVGNKTGSGKVLGLIDGREVPVKRHQGKTGRHVVRDATDYIFPEQEGEAIISREVWQAAQDKIAARGKQAAPARNPDLWLAGLVACGVCGGCMMGFTRTRGAERHCFCCSHHRRYGAASKCKLNKVPHRLVQALLMKYLDEAGVKLEKIAFTHVPGEALRALQEAAWSRSREYLGTLAEMVEVLHAAGIRTGEEIDGQWYDTCDVQAEYRHLHQARQKELAGTISAKEEELRGYVRNIPKLSSELAIRLAEEEVERLGRELEELKRQALPLDERAAQLRVAIAETQVRYREAREALDGSENRQKGEAVRRVVRRIVLHFEPIENPPPRTPTSRLVRAVIEPLEGEELVVFPESEGHRA